MPDASPDANAVRHRIRFGLIALAARSLLQQLTILGANVYLARVLSPGDYGVFAIVQFAMALFAVFGDVGLGPALIQKGGMPTQRELSTVFWFQLGLSLVVVSLVWVAATRVRQLWPDLPPGCEWLLRGLALAFVFTLLRVVPSLLLERELRFGLLSAFELIGTIVFYSVAVVLAQRGANASSLVLGSLAQAGFMALAWNLARRWRPSLVFDRRELRRMLHFGVHYQGKIVMSFVNSSVAPLVAGTRLGHHGLGLLNFAQNVAWFPVQLISIVGRVSFPAFSRLQHDRAALAAEVERALLLCATATLFFVGLCLGIGPSLVNVIYTEKWQPALPALYVYALSIGVGFFSPIIAAVFDALGRPQVVFRLILGWSVVNWISVLLATQVAATPLAFALGYSVHVVLGNSAIVILLLWSPNTEPAW